METLSFPLLLANIKIRSRVKIDKELNMGSIIGFVILITGFFIAIKIAEFGKRTPGVTDWSKVQTFTIIMVFVLLIAAGISSLFD